MSNEKKLTKEDTWRPADLRKHIREEGHGSKEHVRRRDGSERRHRGGESTERRHGDPGTETRRDRDSNKHRERDNTRERSDRAERDRLAGRRTEGSRDRRGDGERDRRDERDGERRRERDRPADGRKYDDHNGDRRRDRDRDKDREGKHDREGDRDRGKERDGQRRNKEDGDKRREERDKEGRREDREHRGDRTRHEDKGEGDREKRERERRKDQDVRDRDRDRERRGDRKDEREHREERRRHKEEREKRHRQDERQKRTERDKHRERRHRDDEENTERDQHKEGTGSRKSTTDKSHGNETKTEVIQDAPVVVSMKEAEDAVCEVQDEAEQEYEDDFEDYEEDFEELDEGADEEEESPKDGEDKEEIGAQRRKEIEAIQRAMDEENERVGTAQSRQSIDREEEETPKWSRGSELNQSTASQRGKFIDFVAAKQREVSKKVATKQKKRSTELLRLIELDFSMTFSLLDLPPVNEYDMYIRNFGTANTKQAYVQCNEDNADRDIQTEEIEVAEKWTQHPPEHCGACGDPNLSQDARDKTGGDMNFDSQRLTAFLHTASQVMVVLLEEDQAESKSVGKLKSQTDTLSFSDGSLQLNTKLPFLYGRRISLVHFSQVQRHTMMSVHCPTTDPSAVRLDSCTIVCIWNIWEPSRPQKVLVYESEVQCCCFSPGKATLVFAGTSVGSVLLWDLREHINNHHRLKIGEDEWTFRQPTFSTDAVMAASGHFSSVTSVEVVPSAASGGLRPEVPLLASEEESSGLSFQLASLDESGILNFWVVVELPKANEAGSPTDLGLRPGGKVKLLHSSSLPTVERVSTRDAAKTGPLQTLHLKFLPTDSNHFFIGTNMGLVNHGTSHGLKAPPKFYRCQGAGVRPVDVSSIHFSPFMQHLFLVGCGDGSIRLHSVSHEQPMAEWKNGTGGEPIVSLQWAQTRPTVFYVLDAASNIHIWDLTKNDTEPVVTERIHSDRVTATAAFGDSGQQNIYSGVALAHESGKIEMQYFARHLTVPVIAEVDKLESMTTEAF